MAIQGLSPHLDVDLAGRHTGQRDLADAFQSRQVVTHTLCQRLQRLAGNIAMQCKLHRQLLRFHLDDAWRLGGLGERGHPRHFRLDVVLHLLRVRAAGQLGGHCAEALHRTRLQFANAFHTREPLLDRCQDRLRHLCWAGAGKCHRDRQARGGDLGKCAHGNIGHGGYPHRQHGHHQQVGGDPVAQEPADQRAHVSLRPACCRSPPVRASPRARSGLRARPPGRLP